MKIFLALTGTPEEMMLEFIKEPLDFLYHQEDQTEYKVKTISYLIDEIQNIGDKKSNLYNQLSKAGRRRYNTILNQLIYMVRYRGSKKIIEIDKEFFAAGDKISYLCWETGNNEENALYEVTILIVTEDGIYIESKEKENLFVKEDTIL